MEELLQKHRAFTLSVAVGGFVFLVALMVRGCAVYKRDLTQARASVERKVQELNKEPVPDQAYLRKLDAVVEAADRRVAELAGTVGRTEQGEALWAACISDILEIAGKRTDTAVKEYVDLARRLPNAAFTRLLGDVQTVLAERASGANVVLDKEDLGFERIDATDFSRNVAALAAVARVVDRAITEGVDRITLINVGSTLGRIGGTEADPFLRVQTVSFGMKGDPPVLERVVRALNERDHGGTGRRLLLEQVATLGRPTTVRPADPGEAAFIVRVLLVNLDAREEEAK